RTDTRFVNELLPVPVSHSCIACTPCFLNWAGRPGTKPERPVEQWKAVRPYRSDKLLDSFTMQREVQPVALDFLGHAQADRKVDDLEDDRGADAAEPHRQDDALELDPDLGGVAVDQADRSVAALDR